MVRAFLNHFAGFDNTLLRNPIDFERIMEDTSGEYEAVGRSEVDGTGAKSEGWQVWAE
jgi:hypothetical protein